MVVGYKEYQSRRHNSVFDIVIFTAYQMLKEDKRCYLYLALLSELLRNLKKIKQDKKHYFRFGSLIVCLALYLLNEIPGIEKFQWAYDKLVAMQIKEGLLGIGDNIT